MQCALFPVWMLQSMNLMGPFWHMGGLDAGLLIQKCDVMDDGSLTVRACSF